MDKTQVNSNIPPTISELVNRWAAYIEDVVVRCTEAYSLNHDEATSLRVALFVKLAKTDREKLTSNGWMRAILSNRARDITRRIKRNRELAAYAERLTPAPVKLAANEEAKRQDAERVREAKLLQKWIGAAGRIIDTQRLYHRLAAEEVAKLHHAVNAVLLSIHKDLYTNDPFMAARLHDAVQEALERIQREKVPETAL